MSGVYLSALYVEKIKRNKQIGHFGKQNMDVNLNSENAKSSAFSVQKTRSEIDLNPKETAKVQRRWKLFIGGQSAAWEAFSPDRPKFLADSHFAPSDQGWGINLWKSANRLAAIRGLDGSMGRIWDSQTREAVGPIHGGAHSWQLSGAGIEVGWQCTYYHPPLPPSCRMPIAYYGLTTSEL